MKNLFELKNAQRVIIDGNIFENNWGDAQVGYAILFTVRNQDGTVPWSVVRDVQLTNNIIRHSASAIQLLGTDYIHPSQQTERITVANNVFEDIDGAKWNGAGWFLTISDGLVDSPYKNQGTDGKDPGADIDAVAAAGAVSGVWTTAPVGQSPYGGSAAAAPGTIEAENFDEGGEGEAYHDLDAGNNGGEYRSGDVDVRSKSTASNGFVVFNAAAGEWLEYTINVTAAGTYDIGATSASRLAGGTYHIEIDGVDVTGTLTAPATRSWWDFQYAGRSGVSLTAGPHVLRLVLDTKGVEGIEADFDTIRITASASGQTPFQGTAIAVPGTIPASDFDNGGEGVAYHDATAGNSSGSSYRTSGVDMYGTSVLWLEAGEWLEYTVDVGATASTYAIGAEAAGGSFHVEVDGVDKTGPLAVQALTRSGFRLRTGSGRHGEKPGESGTSC